MKLLRRFSKKCATFLQVALSLVAVLTSGMYVNLLCGPSIVADFDSGHPFQALAKLGWWNLLPFAALAVLVLQFQLERLRGRLSRDASREYISSLLEVAVRALVHPRTLDKVQVRAFCHRADTKAEVLRPVCRWTFHHCDDAATPIPYTGDGIDVLVIVKAYRENSVVAEDLPEDHRDRTRKDLRGRIWPDIRSVLAVPIRDFSDASSETLGTVCFDSSEPLDKVRFASNEAKDIIVRIASCIYRLWQD